MASVLIVDDDELLCETIANVIAIDGHDIATASNGNQAIELLESGITPDVIILDILMPQSDGLEVLSYLRKRNADSRVIVISGGSRLLPGTMTINMAQAFGARFFLYKPFSNAELRGKVGEAIEAEAWVPKPE